MASEIGQWLRVLAVKSDDRSSISGTHIVEGENLSSDFHIHGLACMVLPHKKNRYNLKC